MFFNSANACDDFWKLERNRINAGAVQWALNQNGSSFSGTVTVFNLTNAPEIRLHWIERIDVDPTSPDNSHAFLGLSSWVIRPAVGVRVGL